METKEVLLQLRKVHELTQEEMAKRLLVTRQAVSRWETGETIPNAETLKLISKEFHVSINTLLGMPQRLFCQCCGMPLDDDGLLSQEKDGSFNEDYCKWCYTDGKFTYTSMEELMDIAGTVSGNNGTAAKGHDAKTITSTETLEKIKKTRENLFDSFWFFCV